MSTTEFTPMTREQIRARLNEIAPAPQSGAPDVADAVARCLAVDAQLRWERITAPFGKLRTGPLYSETIATMTGRFAALHLLMALIADNPERARELAGQIADAWDDGGGVGEWLWEHEQALGIDPAEVDRLEDAWQATEASAS